MVALSTRWNPKGGADNCGRDYDHGAGPGGSSGSGDPENRPSPLHSGDRACWGCLVFPGSFVIGRGYSPGTMGEWCDAESYSTAEKETTTRGKGKLNETFHDVKFVQQGKHPPNQKTANGTKQKPKLGKKPRGGGGETTAGPTPGRKGPNYQSAQLRRT